MAVSVMLIGIIVLAVMVSLCFGWLIPLIVGLVKWSRKTGGKGWLIGSGIWAFCAMVFVGFCIYSAMTVRRRFSTEEFNEANYAGDRAMLVLPYSGSGTLSIRQVGNDKAWRVPFSNTNRVTVPAGTLSVWYLSYETKDQKGGVTGGMNCSFASKEDVVAKAGEVITLQGGAPFTASISAKQAEGDKLRIAYSLTDVAGNSITLWNNAEKNGKPKFEAIGPDGACFWSDELEYG